MQQGREDFDKQREQRGERVQTAGQAQKWKQKQPEGRMQRKNRMRWRDVVGQADGAQRAQMETEADWRELVIHSESIQEKTRSPLAVARLAVARLVAVGDQASSSSSQYLHSRDRRL